MNLEKRIRSLLGTIMLSAQLVAGSSYYGCGGSGKGEEADGGSGGNGGSGECSNSKEYADCLDSCGQLASDCYIDCPNIADDYCIVQDCRSGCNISEAECQTRCCEEEMGCYLWRSLGVLSEYDCMPYAIFKCAEGKAVTEPNSHLPNSYCDGCL